MKKVIWATLAAAVFAPASLWANERMFTYTYEPETMPKGGWEAEQWFTARAGRTVQGDVGQKHFRLWEFRESIEYGVTDNWTTELYFNSHQQSFTDPLGGRHSGYRWDGFSLENRFQVVNPANHPVGVTLYLEPRFSDSEGEVEEKIILGQRNGEWKWAANLTHATEFLNHFHDKAGEVELSFGIARMLGKHWALGLEVRDNAEIEEYKTWDNNAFFAGPVLSYRADRWWATLSVMPQVFGNNFPDDPDHNANLELEDHERFTARLIAGFSF
jgi:hypothetical protein